MKRILIIIGAVLTFLFICTFLVFYISIGNAVKENISIAKKKYPGTAEDALIAYMSDTTNSMHDRTHTAIWTLGKIQSEKALPILRTLYKNDPEGKTCYRKHKTVLCQHVIYNAINAYEINELFLYSRFNK